MRKSMSRDSLTPRQERFVEEYLVDLNGTQAAIRAGYAARTANREGARLLSKAVVRARVREAQEARTARVEVRQDVVLRELLLILVADIRDYQISDSGELVLREGVPEEAARAVASIKRKVTTFGRDGRAVETEIRLWPKDSMIELGGRHLGLFPNKVDIRTPEQARRELAAVLGVPEDELRQREE
jgi:phage terminase small subunit